MNRNTPSRSKQIAICALLICLIAISAQIYIPFSPPITMQLAVIFFICGFFNFKTAFISVWTYITCGAIGLPVFSGFSGGAYALLGTTGGFIVGFLFIPFIFLIYKKERLWKLCFCYCLSITVCYSFGILWLNFYLNSFSGAIKSIIVFLPFDILKATLATVLIKAIKKRIA